MNKNISNPCGTRLPSGIQNNCPQFKGRPTKRDRREIERLKNGG